MENLFIQSLAPNDKEILQLHLNHATLESGRILFEESGEAPAVYFPINAIISLVVTLSTGETLEAAMVGRDGMVGALAALDAKISMSRAVVQIPGEALRCDAGVFKDVAFQSQTLLSSILKHEQTVFGQAQQSAACIAAHPIEARLARWLLRARDLSNARVLPFTQYFLAEMLGAQRPSVSIVAHALQQAGMIRYSRGKIEITDVAALEQSACECYETVKTQYATLINRGKT